MWFRAGFPVLLLLFPVSTLGAVQSPPEPDFNRDILPIFQRECVGCHSSALKMGGLVLESYQDLMKGGEQGTALVAGHADQSLLVRMLEGTAEPRMPLNGQLPAEQIQLVRAWIDASARPPATPAAADDEVPIPEIRPQVDVEPPLAALAFHPREKWLARGGFRQVELLDLAEDRTLHSLEGPRDLVRSLSFSRDGRLLAAGGGAPAQHGEIRVWNLSGPELQVELKGHSDCVYALDFSPDGRLLASSSYDRMIRLWDIETGAEIGALEEHNGPIYSIAFLPSGNELVSASADGTVKVWDVATRRRLVTLTGAEGPLFGVAVHPDGGPVCNCRRRRDHACLGPERRGVAGETLRCGASERHGATSSTPRTAGGSSPAEPIGWSRSGTRTRCRASGLGTLSPIPSWLWLCPQTGASLWAVTTGP